MDRTPQDMDRTSPNPETAFDYTLDDGFDPFCGEANEIEFNPEPDMTNGSEEDEPSPFLPPDPEKEDLHKHDAAVDTRTPEERTAVLMEEMQPLRKTLLGILSLCLEPQKAEDVVAEVAAMEVVNRSVYSAGALCSQLERAGALARTCELEDAEPVVVVEDGVEYMQPREPKVVFWTTTEVGRSVLDNYRPQDALSRLLADDAIYASIYLELLLLCARDEGATADEMGAAVDSDPLLSEPRLYAAHFFGNLSDCDAIEWTGTSWKTTEIGYQAVSDLQAAGTPEPA